MKWLFLLIGFILGSLTAPFWRPSLSPNLPALATFFGPVIAAVIAVLAVVIGSDVWKRQRHFDRKTRTYDALVESLVALKKTEQMTHHFIAQALAAGQQLSSPPAPDQSTQIRQLTAQANAIDDQLRLQAEQSRYIIDEATSKLITAFGLDRTQRVRALPAQPTVGDFDTLIRTNVDNIDALLNDLVKQARQDLG